MDLRQEILCCWRVGSWGQWTLPLLLVSSPLTWSHLCSVLWKWVPQAAAYWAPSSLGVLGSWLGSLLHFLHLTQACSSRLWPPFFLSSQELVSSHLSQQLLSPRPLLPFISNTLGGVRCGTVVSQLQWLCLLLLWLGFPGSTSSE